jgi:hypothetical protein
VITRDPKKLNPDQISKFTVIDSVDDLKPKDWYKKPYKGIGLLHVLHLAKNGNLKDGSTKNQLKYFQKLKVFH